MLQSMLIKRIERIANLRALLILHATFYGLALVAFTLASDPSGWNALLLAAWLPLVLAHLVFHTIYEVRVRCAVQPQPAEVFRPSLRPVDLYDEQGKLVGSESKIEYLSLPHGEIG